MMELEEIHPMGFWGVLKVHKGISQELKHWTFWLGMIFSILVLLCLIYNDLSNRNLQNFLKEITEIGIGAISALIGLSITGLVLIVSFIEGSTARRMVKIQVKEHNEHGINSKNQFSIYQEIVAKFTWAVLIQGVSFINLWLVYLFSILELPFVLKTGANIFNLMVIGILCFLILYSVLLIIQMCLNIFTLSQVNHSTIYVENIKSIMEEKLEKK